MPTETIGPPAIESELDHRRPVEAAGFNVDIETVVELKRLTDVQAALKQNDILSVSLKQIPLVAMLQEILLMVLGIPWLALEVKKGCIFLTKEKQKSLELVVHHNLGEIAPAQNV